MNAEQDDPKKNPLDDPYEEMARGFSTMKMILAGCLLVGWTLYKWIF